MADSRWWRFLWILIAILLVVQIIVQYLELGRWYVLGLVGFIAISYVIIAVRVVVDYHRSLEFMYCLGRALSPLLHIILYSIIAAFSGSLESYISPILLLVWFGVTFGGALMGMLYYLLHNT